MLLVYGILARTPTLGICLFNTESKVLAQQDGDRAKILEQHRQNIAGVAKEALLARREREGRSDSEESEVCVCMFRGAVTWYHKSIDDGRYHEMRGEEAYWEEALKAAEPSQSKENAEHC